MNWNGLFAMYEPSTTVTTAMTSVKMAAGSKVGECDENGASVRFVIVSVCRSCHPLLLVTSSTGMVGRVSSESHTGSTNCIERCTLHTVINTHLQGLSHCTPRPTD